ncbi:MAG: universal stress protein [Archangium gephyra]|uniref:Universal stress protein n=1 Tax=Archangium gephyra TaxID=48 RepID=A0A2W5U9G3_9BACT|nr:MAG: universal stress protein [Archangium gephyra]
MKSILVAVDGSPSSELGISHAAELARALGAKLELVHVVRPVLLATSAYAETIAKIDEANRLEAKQVLDAAAKIAKAAGVESTGVTLDGAPAEAIADLAQAPHVWGVVIGAKGHSAVSRVLLGSVADRLVHICSKPVLVVR